MNELEDLVARVRYLERTLARVRGIEDMADFALDLFIKKANDLKKIDAKRDDVINLLCQKIADIEKRLNKEG